MPEPNRSRPRREGRPWSKYVVSTATMFVFVGLLIGAIPLIGLDPQMTPEEKAVAVFAVALLEVWLLPDVALSLSRPTPGSDEESWVRGVSTVGRILLVGIALLVSTGV